MKLWYSIFSVLTAVLCSVVNAVAVDCDSMLLDLQRFIDDKDARIGVTVIVNDVDTISINGSREFPMMSVFKFPLALAVAYKVDSTESSLDDFVDVRPSDLKENTYSPMLKKYGSTLNSITLRELLEWSLQHSDNNAADILLNYVGGLSGLNEMMPRAGIRDGIDIGASEDDMHRDKALCYLNRASPLAIATLFNNFCDNKRCTEGASGDIAAMIETCQTGADRLPYALVGTEAIIGHKTGTGDEIIPGRISAINDCGYVLLPGGHHYAIAVFIADSAYDFADTSAMIATISSFVFNHVR